MPTHNMQTLRLTEARSGARVCDPQHAAKRRSGELLQALAITVAALCSCLMATASEQRATTAATTKPAMVYVADFDLDIANIKLAARPDQIPASTRA